MKNSNLSVIIIAYVYNTIIRSFVMNNSKREILVKDKFYFYIINQQIKSIC